MISEVRVILEPLAARKAAQHGGEPVRAQLRDAISELQKMHPKDDQRRLLEYDLVVHRLIYRATNNHHLAETLVQLDDLATRIWCLVQDRIPEISEHIREHIDLMQSILDGDEDRAATLAAEHVRHFEATVRAAL
jgi:DNA-binding GntR family transcriptional regulator